MPNDALRRLIYRSRSRIAGAPAEVARQIAQILDTARRYNSANFITGALLMRDALFAQVIEGPPDRIAETFARIAADDRHHDIAMLSDGPADSRAFAEWSMAYAGNPGGSDIPITLSFAGIMLNDVQTAILDRMRASLADPGLAAP